MIDRFTLILALVGLMSVYEGHAQNEWTRQDVATVRALNLQMDVINICAKSTYRNARTYFFYNESLDEKIESEAKVVRASRFSYSAASLPVKEYERAQSIINDIPSTHRDTVRILFDSLWHLQEAQNRVGEELKQLTISQPMMSDSLADVIYTGLGKLELYTANFRNLSLKLEKVAQQIYAGLASAKGAGSSWRRSTEAMKPVLDTARNYLAMTRAGKFSASHPLDTTVLSNLLIDLVQNRVKNIEGIKEFGSYSGNCAPSRYDKMIYQLRRMMKEFRAYKSSTSYDPKSYEYIVNEFNHAIEEYNAFARISAMQDMGLPPAYLLKSVKEPGLYHMTRPHMEEPKADTQEESEISMEGFAYNHTVLLLDVSGSMNAPNKLPLIKESLKKLSGSMREQDRLSVVIYSNDVETIFRNISYREKEKLEALDTLVSAGKTRAQQGLRMAYSVAQQEFIPEGNNRIIIATDGDFEISREEMKHIKSEVKTGVVLSVFAFGTHVKNADQLRKMAQMGKGNYLSIHRSNSLESLLSELRTPAL